MPMPGRPSSRAVAGPKPLEAPRTSPHAPANGRQPLSSGIPGDDNESPSPALSRPRVVCPAGLRYGRPVGGKGDRPAVENRWWVDQGKDAKGNPLPRPPAAFGGRFFRTGEGFEQERARPGAGVPDDLSSRLAGLRIARARVPLPAHQGCAMEPPATQGGYPMAATEDELAKQKVKEAFWQWTGRFIVLAVTFGFGFFAAFILWGNGLNGAPALRILKEQQEAQILERKNKEVDLSGKLTVIQSRLDQCIADLQKARAAGSAAAP